MRKTVILVRETVKKSQNVSHGPMFYVLYFLIDRRQYNIWNTCITRNPTTSHPFSLSRGVRRGRRCWHFHQQPARASSGVLRVRETINAFRILDHSGLWFHNWLQLVTSIFRRKIFCSANLFSNNLGSFVDGVSIISYCTTAVYSVTTETASIRGFKFIVT